MTDNKNLAAQLRETATKDDFEIKPALRTLMQAVAIILETTDPVAIADLRTDVQSLKKRDWYNLTIAVVVAALTSALAFLKK